MPPSTNQPPTSTGSGVPLVVVCVQPQKTTVSTSFRWSLCLRCFCLASHFTSYRFTPSRGENRHCCFIISIVCAICFCHSRRCGTAKNPKYTYRQTGRHYGTHRLIISNFLPTLNPYGVTQFCTAKFLMWSYVSFVVLFKFRRTTVRLYNCSHLLFQLDAKFCVSTRKRGTATFLYFLIICPFVIEHS